MYEPIIHSYETETNDKENFINSHAIKINYLIPLGITVFVIGITILIITQRNSTDPKNNSQPSTQDNQINNLAGGNQPSVRGEKTSSASGQILKSPSPKPKITPTPAPKTSPTPNPTSEPEPTPEETPTPDPTESPSATPTPDSSIEPSATPEI